MYIRRRTGSWKKVLVFVTSLSLLGLGIYNIVLKASFRLLDDGVFWEERDGRTLAKRVAGDGPAAGAGVRTGDVLVMIDDSPVDSPEDVQRILDRAEEGVSLSYQILRENERRAFAVRIAPLPRGPVGPYYFLAAVGIFSLVVGTIVYVRRRGVRAAAHFYVLCLFWSLAFGFSPAGKLDFWDSAFYWLDRVGVLFFPPIFLHFALCFPKRKLVVKKNRWVLPSLYMPSVLLTGVALAGKLFFFAQVPWGDAFFVTAETILDRLGPTYVSIMSLAAFAAFVDSYRRALTVTVKKQTKWIVWGTGFGTATFAVFYAIPYLFSVQSRMAAEISVIALALIPLSFAYAIVKYRLMDVEVLVKRGVVYTLATATAVSVYLAIFFSGSRYLAEESNRTVIAVLATLVAVLVFTPLKKRIQVGIDRLFYREKFDYRRALLAFSRDLNAHLDLDLLSLRLVERIRDTFEVEKVALLGPDGEGSDLSLVAGCGLSETESSSARIGTDSELFSRLTGGEMVCSGELDSPGARWCAPVSSTPAALSGGSTSTGNAPPR